MVDELTVLGALRLIKNAIITGDCVVVDKEMFIDLMDEIIDVAEDIKNLVWNK